MPVNTTDVVADPVSHISISGFHGVDEVDKHVSTIPTQAELNGDGRVSARTLIIGALLGAGLMYLIGRARR